MQQVEASAFGRGGLTLEGLKLSSTRIMAGEPLLVDLWLTVDQPVRDDLTLCVHLMPETGPVLASRDGTPGYGGAPTAAWVPGEVLHEQRAVPIPAGALPGTYTLTAVWLDAEGRRVPLADGSGGVPTGDEAALATVEVVAAP